LRIASADVAAPVTAYPAVDNIDLSASRDGRTRSATSTRATPFLVTCAWEAAGSEPFTATDSTEKCIYDSNLK
jgi:hypothetical protein